MSKLMSVVRSFYAKVTSRMVGVIILAILGFIAVFVVAVVFVFWTPADRAVLLSRHQNVTHDDIERSYLLYKPSGDIEKIIVGIHGFGDNARRFAYYTALHNVIDDKTLVVYPQASQPMQNGIKNGWNAGFCCGSGWVGKVDDVGFLSSLITSLNNEHASGEASVYVTGFSNGAFMAQRMAAERPELMNAVAVSSGSIGTTEQQLKPQEPIPILLMHGEKDTIVPFSGGTGSSDPDFVWLEFSETRKAWEAVNGEGAETDVITFPDNGHKWDGWRIANFWHRKPNASIQSVKFFDSH